MEIDMMQRIDRLEAQIELQTEQINRLRQDLVHNQLIMHAVCAKLDKEFTHGRGMVADGRTVGSI